MKVVILNNYSVKAALGRISEGTYPTQHLWGMYELDRRVEWVIPNSSMVDWSRKGPVAHLITRKAMPLVGDILQQTHALWATKDGGVIYAADQQSSVLLCVLRRLRILRRPIVLMVHNGPRTGWSRLWMKGADCILTLSEGIKQRMMADCKISEDRIQVMPWGPNPSSPVYEAIRAKRLPKSLDFVAAGKTNRSYETLCAVAEEHTLSGLIFTADAVIHFENGVRSCKDGPADYLTILSNMARATSVVIPIEDKERISGLTEAADAMALNVPIIVSKSQVFPYDIDRLGGGAAIDTDDHAAVINGIRTAQHQSDATKLVGAYNMTSYADRLQQVFQSVGRKS